MPTTTRVLNCSTSLENYYICIEEKVAGFSNRGPQSGDQVYLAVKIGKTWYISEIALREYLGIPTQHAQTPIITQ